MLQILLIRPGATEFDRHGRIQGTLDIPLCEDGRIAVAAMVEDLRSHAIDAIYASPCQSAQETAELLADATDVKAKTVDKLHNLDHGLWQGLLISEVKTKQPKVYRQWQEQPETICPPQGESVCAAKQRVQVAVAKLVKKHKGDSLIALVVPLPLACLVRHVLRRDELCDLWKSPNGAPLWELIEVSEAEPAK